MSYIQNKLDELIETYRKENYSEYDVRMVAERLVTDYHNHIVEKIMNLVKTTGHPYMFSLTEERFEKDLRSLLQDTNPKE